MNSLTERRYSSAVLGLQWVETYSFRNRFPQRDHGRCVGIAPRGILSRSRVGDDLGGAYAGMGGGDGAMGAYGHLYHPAAIAGLDDIDLASGGVNAHPESFDIMMY